MKSNQTRQTVDILLPIGFNSPYLEKCINSLKNEDFQDWRIIAILDVGDVLNLNLLQNMVPATSLKVIEIPSPHTLSQKLNAGIAVSSAKYLARMDADDIIIKDRLMRQVEYLDDPNHEHIVGVGACAIIINENDEAIGEIHQPNIPKKILSKMIWRNAFIHPSMMFRREVFEENYFDPRLTRTQDYELWLRILTRYEMSNIPDALLGYRLHGENSSKKRINLLDAYIIYKSKKSYAMVRQFPKWKIELSSFIWTFVNLFLR